MNKSIFFCVLYAGVCKVFLCVCVCVSRESPVEVSVAKRSRHVSSSDGGQQAYQASYPEPRASPQSTTEEKRVIVPAGESRTRHPHN